MPNLSKLKKIALTTAIGGPTALGLAVGAHAAPAPGTQQPFSVELGASFLTDSNSRNATADTGFHVGLGYDLTEGKSTQYGTPSIDLDYDNNSGHGNYLQTYGAFLADRYYLTQTNSKSNIVPYIGAGIGLAYIQGRATRRQDSGYPLDIITTSHVSKSATNFAGKLLAGVAFGQAYVEVAYQINGSVSGANADTIDLSIGTHF
jgi:hypothetical protein